MVNAELTSSRDADHTVLFRDGGETIAGGGSNRGKNTETVQRLGWKKVVGRWHAKHPHIITGR